MSKQQRRNGKTQPMVGIFPPEPTSAKAKKPSDDEWLKTLDDGFEPQMPEWAERCLERLADSNARLSDLVAEDHQMLVDQEVRLCDLESLFEYGEWAQPSIGAPEPMAPEPKATEPKTLKAKAPEPKATEPKTLKAKAPEPQPQPQQAKDPQPQPKKAKSPEPQFRAAPQPAAQPRANVIPAQMYEYWDHKAGIWQGPLSTIAAAKQAAGGLLSGVRIIYVWFDTERRVVLDYLSAEDILRYCPK